MPRATTSWTLRGVPRVAVGAASAALGAAALCLIVFSASQRLLQLGVLLGLWSALIATYLIVGTRHVAGQDSEAELAQVLSEQLGSLREEVAALRAEVVTALRAEVVDKLGGQLRLERIETTRVIGSDLEALQHEIRRLAGGGQQGVAAAARAVAAVAPGRPEQQPVDIVHAELVEFPPPAVELAEEESVAERQAGRRRAPEPEPSEVRYQGRRRADGDPAGRLARVDT